MRLAGLFYSSGSAALVPRAKHLQNEIMAVDFNSVVVAHVFKCGPRRQDSWQVSLSVLIRIETKPGSAAARQRPPFRLEAIIKPYSD
jgi:hypothetical protein